MSGPIPFAYLSPETLLPVTSIAATIMGVVMMLGSRSAQLVRAWIRRAFQSRRRSSAPRPHFLASARSQPQHLVRSSAAAQVKPWEEG